MRFIKWLLSIPFVLMGVIFAFNSPSSISLDLWPSEYALHMPLTLFAFIIFAFGYFAGYISRSINNKSRRYPR